ncbi:MULTISPECIES: iron ABC transporter permease [Actinosynnema]|uniref:FecCD family ABC transporter permease n=1 Tax=Actinosynnema TaxID=40566 RepID=UPI0020A30E48|nr:iron ABC transporter permease [Actinosynnema pretiosum]MCP2096492.1 iron complex transport system permease protein [Actinosynnema pretiosum]
MAESAVAEPAVATPAVAEPAGARPAGTGPPPAPGWRLPAGALALLALLAGAVLLSLLVGGRGLTPAAVWAALLGDGAPESTAIVLGQRLPRTVIGLLGGCALAVAGALVQGHTRNPLADPGLLGVTSGASLAVVLAISLLGLTTPAGHLWFAFAGAALGTVVVTAIGLAAGRERDASPASLALAGAAVSALLSAVTGVLLLLDAGALDVHRFWTVGSLAGGRGFDVVAAAGPPLLLGLLVALAHAPALNTLALGDDLARALGRRLLPARLVGLLAVTLLVGSATALVGSLGFVGLVAPHLVRGFTGPDHRALLPVCAVAGAVLVLLADVLGRVLIAPAELPVGIVLGVAGGPAFLLVVVRHLRGAR